MPTIYPLLKPHDWPHQELVVCRKFGIDVPKAPIITFGFDAGANYQFIPKPKCDDVEALYVEALENLARLAYPWEMGESHGLRFAASSGNEFSAERVLDQGAMSEAHRLLESDRILIAAPRRTCLMAAPARMTDASRELFVNLALFTYRDDSYGHAPISPAVFTVENGIVTDLFVPDAESARKSTGVASARKPWWKFWG